MADAIAPRHGLEPFLATVGSGSDGGVSIRIQQGVACVNLRGDPDDPAITGAIETALGQALPATSNSLSQGKHRVYWLGPDEWLVVSADSTGTELASMLAACAPNKHIAVNDVSGGNVTLQLAGTDADKVLARGCTLDLHPDVFRIADCAQTGLAKASVLIGKLDDSPVFELIVRRSFSEYVCLWLERSARAYGGSFTVG